MSDRPRLVSPLLLRASAPAVDAEAVLNAAVATNAKAEAQGSPPPLEWVVVQHSAAFELKWYLLRLTDVSRAIADAADKTASLSATLRLQDHQEIKAIQLAELRDTTGPAVVLTGNRVFGLVEPQLRAAMGGAQPGGLRRGAGGGRGGGRGGGGRLSALARGASGANGGPAAPVYVEAAAYVNAPRRVQPGKRFKLEIGLDKTPPPGVEGGEVAIPFQPGEEEIYLDIRIECEGFTSEKGFEHTLKVSKANPFDRRVKLWLKAKPLTPGVDEELRALQILYACKGAPCGSATYRILVQRIDKVVEVPLGASDMPRLSIDTSAPPIDLTLWIKWQDDNEATHTLLWSYTSPHAIPAPTGKMVRHSAELASLPIGIVDELAQGDGIIGIDLLISSIGKRIADEIPAGVWQVLDSVTKAVRAARGETAIPTVLLSTQETRVPWELALIPKPPDPARPPHLNTQYIVTRWVLDDNIRALPPHTIGQEELVAVFGDYANAGVSQLPFARKEAEFIEQRKGKKFDATREAIIGILTDREKDANGVTLAPRILHFAGHGEAGRSGTAASFIVLNDGSTLSTTYFLNAPALKRNHPLVFLNACQLGAATATLGQPGGFAVVCVRAECSVVIAPLWSVNDQVAFQVATEFYDDVLGRPGVDAISVAEAMFNARQKPLTEVTVTDANGVQQTRTTATRMAYLVYGHPEFRF